MKSLKLFGLLLLFVLSVNPISARTYQFKPSVATRKKAVKTAIGFQGEWRFDIYAENKKELPSWCENCKVKDLPAYGVQLTLKQRGNRLTGECSASYRFGFHLETSDVAAVIKGNRARFVLESGWGGNPTVEIVLRGNKLSWKIIKASGEHYYLDQAVLRKVSK